MTDEAIRRLGARVSTLDDDQLAGVLGTVAHEVLCRFGIEEGASIMRELVERQCEANRRAAA